MRLIPAFKKASLFFVCSFFSSCGYRLSGTKEPVAIQIPLIKGDLDGALTGAIAKELGATGDFVYVNSKGKYQLDVTILEDKTEHIGYEYDRQPISMEIITRLMPNEGRRTMKVSVSLVDRILKKSVFGPIEVFASTSYDFVNPNTLYDLSFTQNGALVATLPFSLGQLDAEEGAIEVSKESLSQNMAKRIGQIMRRQWIENN